MGRGGDMMRRIGAFLRRGRLRTELAEEMRLHQELLEEENLRAGMPPPDARRAAKRQFGNTTFLREESATEWGWGWLEQIVQDATYGVRAMLRSPGVTVVALVSL